MTGEIRLGSWRRFSATQVLAPPTGFIWAANTRLFGLPVSGYDRYSSGTGQMRRRLLGVVPVMVAQGPDVTRSAAGRLAGEGVLVPTTFRRASWAPTATGQLRRGMSASRRSARSCTSVRRGSCSTC